MTISSISVSNYICIFILVQRTFFLLSANKRSLQKNERKGLKWLTMSILFSWPWELVVVTYNGWNRTPESNFQITRGHWGTVMGEWSVSFTAAFFVSFTVTIFVPDIEGIQKKVTCLWIGTAYSVNVTSMCSANLYDISRRKPSRRAPT